MRDKLGSLAALPVDSAPIAGLHIVMRPTGEISWGADMIDPEQCDSFIAALDGLRERLKSHRDDPRWKSDITSLHKAVGCP